MANLTEISLGVRKIGKLIGLLIVSIIILRFIVYIGIAYWQATHQLPPPPPDVAFGKLPKIKFSDKSEKTAGYNFTLINIEGKPPETTAAARVFTMPKKTYTFESGENAKYLAKRLNFETTPNIDTVYYYYTAENDPRLTLFIDGTNLNFQYKYNYLENPFIFQTGLIPSTDEAERNVKEFLNFSNLWDDSILNGLLKSEILIYDDRLKKMVEATSLSTAHAVKVNFFRKDIDKLPLLSDEFNKSHNYALYAPTIGSRLSNILEISYIFWPIDFSSYGSYPLLTSDEAYQALTSGSAHIINKGNNNSDIILRKIYLAYLDSAIPQTYIQPIFVFEGDNNFVAYLPAIRPEYFTE